MSARILVTGGAGFLGSHLCRRLIADGGTVTCLDNFATGTRANIAHLVDHQRFTLIERDVAAPLAMEVDTIFNLACPASPVSYQKDPTGTTRTTVLGALAMLDLARASGAVFLQASTSEIYGDPTSSPQSEAYWGNVNPIGVRACYNEAKRCAESLVFDYRRQFGVRGKIARIFNTYGPAMQPDDGRVVSNFIVAALKGEPITVYGDGSQTRSFCHVGDLIEGLVRLAAAPDAVTGPVNLGSQEEVTIFTLAKAIIDLTGSRSQIVHLPLPGDDPRQRRPDLALAAQQLGWRPGVKLEAGLKETIAYFEAMLAGGAAA